MAVNSVGRVEKVTGQIGLTDLEREEQRRRLDLNATESFERGSVGVDVSALSGLIDPQAQAVVAAQMAQLSADDRGKLEGASRKLGSALLSSGLSSTSDEVEAASSEAVTTYLATTGAQDLADANHSFMYMAVTGLESVLGDLALDMKVYNGAKSELRTEVTELCDMVKNWPEGEKQSFSWIEVTKDKDGAPVVSERTEELDKAGAEKLLAELETLSQNVGDDAQMFQLQLQQALEKVNENVSLLATIQKQMYDDAMKVLNNLRA